MRSLLRGLLWPFRGWPLFLLCCASLLLLARVDQDFVASAPLHGFYPADAQWVYSTTDFPTVWRALQGGDIARRMRDNWPRPESTWELAIRQSTGIRPTPMRWRVWLGERFVIAASPQGTGICAYPGLLLRAADRVNRFVKGGNPETAISQFGSYSYAWRNGFLIASTAQDYVTACLSKDASQHLRSRSDGLPALQWFGEHDGFLRATKGPGLPFEGGVRLEIADGDTPLGLTNAWPDEPLAALTARSGNDLLTVGMLIDNALEQYPAWSESKSQLNTLAEHWELKAPAPNWDNKINQVAVALFDFNTEHTLPVPDLALVLRQNMSAEGRHPLAHVFGTDDGIPYEWAGEPGAWIPIWGSELSPFLGYHGRDWITTSNEPRMASLAGRLTLGPTVAAETDITLRITWSRVADALERIVQTIAPFELIPEMNTVDLHADVLSKLQAAGKLGHLEVDGTAEEGWLVLKGNLFAPDTRAAE